MNNNNNVPRQSCLGKITTTIIGAVFTLIILGGLAFLLFSPSSPLGWFSDRRDYPYSGYYYYLNDYYYYQNGTWYIYDDYHGWLRSYPDSYLRDHYRDYYQGDAYDNGYGARDFYDGDYRSYRDYDYYYDDGYYDDGYYDDGYYDDDYYSSYYYD